MKSQKIRSLDCGGGGSVGLNLSVKWPQDSDIMHVTDQEQAGLIPKTGNTVVTIHDLFHLFPSKRNDIQIGDAKVSGIREERFGKNS